METRFYELTRRIDLRGRSFGVTLTVGGLAAALKNWQSNQNDAKDVDTISWVSTLSRIALHGAAE